MKPHSFKVFSLVSLSFLLASCSLFGTDDYSYNQGNNSGNTIINNAKEIKTTDELLSLSGSSESYVLKNDLDLTAYDNWTPINNFSGKLDGDNHLIHGLKISGSTSTNQGLFSSLSKNAVIKNLKIDANLNFKGESTNLGILAGANEGTIDNVITSGTIEAEYSTIVGGVVGLNSKQITNSVNKAEIKGFKRVGGIAGEFDYGSNTTLTDNKNEGKITGKDNSVGGIIGCAHGIAGTTSSSYKTTIESNTNSAEIYSDGSYVGGIVGYNETSESFYGYGSILSISSSENTGKIEGKSNVGGILGYGTAFNSLGASKNLADITAHGDYVGGYIGYAPDGKITNADNKNAITGNAYLGGIAGFVNAVQNCNNTGALDSKSATLIDNDLMAFVGGVAGVATTVKNCTNKSNINIQHEGKRVGGIVGEYRYGSNTDFSNNQNDGNITAKSNSVGGLIGRALGKAGTTSSNLSSKLEENTNNGNVVSEGSYVGGILGSNNSSESFYGYGSLISITSNTNNGTINGNDYVAGIAGAGDYISSISVCENNADITATGNYTGGYLGSSDLATLKYLTNKNKITGNAFLGGIAGKAKFLESCENQGKIVCNGGIYEGTTNYLRVGGVVGFAKNIKNCTNKGSFEFNTSGVSVGGIVGHLLITGATTIEGNKNYSDISVNASTVVWLGGIAGTVRVENSSTSSNYNVVFQDNTNEGNLTSNCNCVGGIVGYINSVSTNIYSKYGITSFTNNINKGNIKGFHYTAGILGYGEHIKEDDGIWNTNTQSGQIDGNESDSGNYYGVINP